MTTNYEKIKNMSIEEMAKLLLENDCENYCAANEYCFKSCEEGVINWLRQESGE